LVSVCLFIHLYCSALSAAELEGDVVGWMPKTYKRRNKKISDDVCEK